MSEIDWSKAPEGATHYDINDSFAPWMKMNKEGEWEYYDEDDGFWLLYHTYSSKEEGYFIPLPKYVENTNTKWVDGLPPVGEKCEINLYGYWFAATISAYGRSKFLYEILPGQFDHEGNPIGGELDGYTSLAKFRPIRTESERQRNELIRVISECDEMAYSVRPDDIADTILSKYNITEK